MCWSGRRARNRGHVRVAYGHPRHSRASCPQPGDTVNSDQISITVGTIKIGRKWPSTTLTRKYLRLILFQIFFFRFHNTIITIKLH